jgi:hypothetical protein
MLASQLHIVKESQASSLLAGLGTVAAGPLNLLRSVLIAWFGSLDWGLA